MYAQKIGDRSLYIAHGNNCTKIVASNELISASTVHELCAQQEEADTRMFQHALHASQDGHQQVTIRLSDTDVEMLACYHQEDIPARIVFLSGTQSRSRAFSILDVCQHLGIDIYRSLLGLHALTGCDTVSTFCGKGKKKGF